MESELLNELKKQSQLANETIERLKVKVTQLKSKSQKSDDVMINDLKNENKKLKDQVEALKKELITLDSQQPATQPKVNSTPTPAKPVESQKQTQQENKQQKQQAEGGQDTKKSKEKKDKQTNNAQAAAAATTIDPTSVDISKLDIRVGKIIKCEKHPEADALYVEQIDLGEAKPRTVCSGLVKYIPLEEMQNRLVLLLCNLKPAKLRGIASEAMVLCASTPEKVELLIPPENSQIGERVTVAGFEGVPEKEINTKNKIFEYVQPDLKTNDDLVATYKGIPFEIKSKGVVKTSTLKNVPIK